MRKLEIVLGARFHRARDIDQQQHLAWPRPPLQPPKPHHLAVVACGFAQNSPQVCPGPAPRAHAPMAAPARQMAWGLAREPAQRVARPGRAEATFRQRFGSHRHFAGYVGFVGKLRFLVAAPLLLQPHHFVILALVAPNLFSAEEVDSEQKIVGSAPLRRRRQGRQPGLPDVLGPARAEQRNRLQERGGLLGRDCKTVGAQQRHERYEGARGAGQLRRFAHAAASAISASSRPAMKARSSSSFSATPIERLNASGQRAPPLLSNVAASAQSTASATPGALLSGSRRSLPTAATTARAVASATLEARIMMILASRSAVG